MKITYENKIDAITEAVKTKAMYSKVMLLYDDYVSNAEIDEIYRAIKDLCIFNKTNLALDLTEVFNGYKLLIFVCGTNSFLTCGLPLKDFCNVFVPTDEGVLPYFLCEGKVEQNLGTLVLKNNAFDGNVFSSVAFNNFYAYLSNLFNTTASANLTFCDEDITPSNLICECQNLLQGMEFVDVKIMSKMGIDYNLLPVVDYVLINAFYVVVDALKNNTLCLTDFYKFDKDNYEIIDKFYAISNNDLLLKLVQYNFASIQVVQNKAKQKIEMCLNCVPTFSKQDLSTIIAKIKQFCKTDEGLLAYLYLYDIF